MGKRSVVLSIALSFLVITAWGAPSSAALDCGEPVLAPKHHVGQKWTWRDERGGEITELVQAEGDMTEMKLPNGDVAIHDQDLVVRQVKRRSGEIVRTQSIEPAVAGLRSVNATVGKKTLDFPLQVGKRWSYSYFASAAKGGRGTVAPYWYTFSVVACEEVSTPAGKFPAFKVEVTEIYNDRASTASSVPTHGIYHVWYAPQVENYVKRHYENMPYWIGPAFRDFELISFEGK